MVTSQRTTRAVSARPTNAWAVAAFVFSLFGWYALPIPILSGILAFVAVRQTNERAERGRALAQFAQAFAILLVAAHFVILLQGGPVTNLTVVRFLMQLRGGHMTNLNW